MPQSCSKPETMSAERGTGTCYPGARCDVESLFYSYSFDRKLAAEWDWTERYAAQPEILEYARHVCERYGLRPFIRFNSKISSVDFIDFR